MAKFGDFVKYGDAICKVVAVAENGTLTLEPTKRVAKEITHTIETSRTQYFLEPVGGSRLASIAGDDVTVVGYGTAVAKSLVDEQVVITFDSDGGTEIVSQLIVSGGKATAPDAPTKEGFTFDAWYSDEALENAVTFASDTFDADTILYASWTEDE